MPKNKGFSKEQEGLGEEAEAEGTLGALRRFVELRLRF
jgi:hypothetical protein